MSASDEIAKADKIAAMLAPLDGYLALLEKQFEVWAALPNVRDNLALRSLAADFRARACRIAAATERLCELFRVEEGKQD